MNGHSGSSLIIKENMVENVPQTSNRPCFTLSFLLRLTERDTKTPWLPFKIMLSSQESRQPLRTEIPMELHDKYRPLTIQNSHKQSEVYS